MIPLLNYAQGIVFMRLILSFAALLWAAPVAAQTGLLVVAHGANAGWNARVDSVVAQVRWPHGPVRVAYLMGPAAASQGWDQGVDGLVAAGVREVIVVPLMVSSAGSHVRQIRHYAGELAEVPAELAGHDHRHGDGPPPVPMRTTPALDASPELGLALLERWRQLPAGDRVRPLVLLAHGPNDAADAERWERDLRAAARLLGHAGQTGEVVVGLLRDDAPAPVRAAAVAGLRTAIAARAAAAADSVVVMPVLISSGQIDGAKIPADLAGLPVAIRRAPLAPSPELARWIERVAADARQSAVARMESGGEAAR